MSGALNETTVPLGGGNRLRALVGVPPAPGAHPGVVVLHESFGLNDDIARIARRFVDCGYAALAPSLYTHGSRVPCLARLLVSTWRGDIEAVTADVLAARDALGSLPEVDADRIAVVGFCQGGGFALAAATKPGVRAAAVHYGAVPTELSRLQGACPIVASFGGRDRLYGSTMARRLEDHLTSLGVDHDVKTYPDVGHSFMNDPGGWQCWIARLPSPLHVGYGEAEAEDAWRRILDFFSVHV